MTESSFSGDDDLAAGSTVESDETPDSATSDREAAFDDPKTSAAGTVTGEDAVVANPPENSTVDEFASDSDSDTSHDADVAAGFDNVDSDTTRG